MTTIERKPSKKRLSGSGPSNGTADVETQGIRQYVLSALTNKAKGVQTGHYVNLVKELSTLRRQVDGRANSDAEHSLAALLTALTSCVSALKERKHDSLLSEVLSIGLWSCPEDVRNACLELMVHIMVANAAFIQSCLKVLLFSLLPPPALPAQEQLGSAWAPEPSHLRIQDQVVGALEKAMQLVPTLGPQLLQLLVQNLPHKLRDRSTQCLYLRGAMALAEGPAGRPIRDGLLLGLVDHLLSIDVEIKWEDIVDTRTGQEQEEEGDDPEEDEHEDIFELEGMSELEISAQAAAAAAAAAAGQELPGLRGGWEGGAQQQRVQSGAAASTSSPVLVDEAADKLDSMMELVFAHLGRRCDTGELGWVWQAMMSAFERSLLHTYRCKFTQFLVFYLCLKDPAGCSHSFITLLLGLMRDSRQAPITRSACAAYLASFLARYALVPEALVVDVLQKLAASCQEYAASAPAMSRAGSSAGLTNGDCSTPKAHRHQVYYAMMQALLYILCYHMEPLVRQQPQHPGSRPEHAAAVASLVSQQVLPLLHHHLTPLAVLLPSVSREFMRQVAVLQLGDCSDLADAVAHREATAAIAAAAAASAGEGGGAGAVMVTGSSSSDSKQAVRPLEMFFPFDPYLLQRSASFLELERCYVVWRGGHPTAAAAGEEDEEEGTDLQEVSEEEEGEEASGGASGDESDSDTSSTASGASGDLPPRPRAYHHPLAKAASGRVLPVGVAGITRSFKKLSGPSPDPMATSLLGPSYMGGMSPGQVMFGGSPLYGSSPMGAAPMSYTMTDGAALMQQQQHRQQPGLQV